MTEGSGFKDTPRTRRLYPFRLLTLLLYSPKPSRFMRWDEEGNLELNPAYLYRHERVSQKTIYRAVLDLEKLGFLTIVLRQRGKWILKLEAPKLINMDTRNNDRTS